MGYTFRFWEREMWMPWKASSMMEERLRFVARLLDGETTTDVCREFGVTQPLVVRKSLADLFQNLIRERDAFGVVS
jgi:transposase-like protein